MNGVLRRLNKLAGYLRKQATVNVTPRVTPQVEINAPQDAPISDDQFIAQALAKTGAGLERLVPLPEHCDALRYLYVSLEEIRPVCVEEGGEFITWSHAADWLHLAAGITAVEVDAGRFDEFDFMCWPTYEYNQRQSKHYSLIARELVAFNMIWGSLESAAKLARTPRVPKALCPSPSEIDRTLYCLKLARDRIGILSLYRELVGALVTNLRASSLRRIFLLNASIATRPHIGLEGLGLHLVRKVRNSFAHGATRLEFNQELTVPPLALVIHMSSRICLLAQQALLLALTEEALTLRVYHGMRTYVPWHGETLAAAARALHLVDLEHDEDQMWLWPALDPEVRRKLDFDFCGEWVSSAEVNNPSDHSTTAHQAVVG